MSLVEEALARPKEKREAYLRDKCGNDSELFRQAWNYIQWEERMGNFLLDPIYPLPENDRPFQPGQMLINRFRIVREVARGGMGIVWQAWDQKLDRMVAIKSAKAGLGDQLPPEVLHASEISHPNICKTFEIHTAYTPQGEIDFISMEFLEGETLSARLRRGPLPKEEALAIALQLCDGLSEAHRNGIIHGDLKSNNVILARGPDGSVRAVITDFGLARRPNASGQNPFTDVLAGTPAYMAPELWKGANPSVASDIYALGVVFWELISGRRPNDLGVTSTTLSWNERPKWKPPAGYGKKWDRVLACCLQADPERRFKSAKEVAQALGPSLTRKRLLTAAAAAVLAIATGVITYQIVTAPPETARLALLPFSTSRDHSTVAEKLLRDTATHLAGIKGNSHLGFQFISEDRVLRKHADTPDKAHAALGATHVLQGNLEQKPQTIILHAYLTDTRNGVNVKEWTAEYKPGELRYAPTALAGVVTNALHLPLAETPTVNVAARKDYLAGLSAVRRNSGVDKALADFERAIAADHDSPLPYAELAEAQYYKYSWTGGKSWLDRTRESLRQAEIRSPDLAQAHYVTGILKENIGQPDQAIAEYLRVIELESHNGDAYRHLGLAYEQNHQADQALVALHKAVEVDPQYYKNHRDLAYFYYKRASYEEAVKHLQAAVALAPKEPLIHFSLGSNLMSLGRFDAAEHEFRTSLQLGETADALNELGLLLIYQKKGHQAIPIIQRALILRPEQHLWWTNLGIAYHQASFVTDSKRSYLRGLDLAETDITKNPRDNKVRSHLAYLAAQLGDKRRAEFEIAQALQQAPEDNDVRWMAAITYEVLGRRDDTLSVLATSPAAVLASVNRWPDLADLRKDPRFLQLLTSHSRK